MARRDARLLDHQTLEELRVRAIEAARRREGPEPVGAVFWLSRSTVFGWLAQYRAGGWEALKATPVPGRPPKTKGSQIERSYKAIAGKTPQQYRFEFALWTLDLVRWLIAEEFVIRLDKTSTWRPMKQMRLSAQRPLWRALERDANRVGQWNRDEYPKLQTLAKAESARIWFGGEARVRSDYHRGATWAPVGDTPVVKTTGARYRWNMISAVNGRGDMRFMLNEKTVTAGVFVEFLRRLRNNAHHPVFLFVGGRPTLHASTVRQLLEQHEDRIRLFPLPPYSPGLNPGEQIGREVKADGAGRMMVAGKDQRKKLLLISLRKLQRMPAMIQGFFKTPETIYAIS